MPTHCPTLPTSPVLLGYDHDGHPIYQYFGADSGINTEGDVLVNQTADGVPLSRIWAEVNEANRIYNAERSAIVQLLSYATTNIADAVPQSISSESFDEASEFGEPTGVREPADALLMGYPLADFDKATRMSWRFLRDATAEQVEANINRIYEADNKLTTGSILQRLFDPTEGLNAHGHRVFGLWNGIDGLTPPPYMGRTFTSGTSHYLASEAAVIDSGDVEDLMRLVTAKGYGAQPGSQLLILANPVEGEAIQTWRAGEESRPTIFAKHDFVRSEGAPAYLTEENIIGAIPPAEYKGLKVLGSYGDGWLIQSQFIPAGWIAVVATGGPNSTLNPLAFREHANPAYRGLRMIPGNARFPIMDSFFSRSFGVGARHRGAAAVAKITTGSYTVPTIPR